MLQCSEFLWCSIKNLPDTGSRISAAASAMHNLGIVRLDPKDGPGPSRPSKLQGIGASNAGQRVRVLLPTDYQYRGRRDGPGRLDAVTQLLERDCRWQLWGGGGGGGGEEGGGAAIVVSANVPWADSRGEIMNYEKGGKKKLLCGVLMNIYFFFFLLMYQFLNLLAHLECRLPVQQGARGCAWFYHCILRELKEGKCT